jgi:hypothetical protein
VADNSSILSEEVVVAFQISALPKAPFEELFTLDDEALAARGAKRSIVESKPGVPCRVSLADAEPGEVAILVPFRHQPADSPYQASGPIFVRQSARQAFVPLNTVPEVFRTRLLSVRAYDRKDLMTNADVVDGQALETLVERLFEDAEVSYLHVHFARPGCFACRIDRTS